MKQRLAGVFVLAALLTVTGSSIAQTFSEWTAPVNLGNTINTASAEQFVFITRNGLTIYFASDRAGGFGGLDIYVASRPTLSAPWGAAQNLGPKINTAAMEHCPFVTPDSGKLIFASDRAGTLGQNDLYMALRQNTHDDLAWDGVTNVVELNSTGDEYGFSGFEEPESGTFTAFFNSSRPGGAGGLDIYTSEIGATGRFAAPRLVAELSSKDNDRFPMVRFDGLELFATSNRTGALGGEDLWASTRGSTGDPWSQPVNPGPPLNTSANDTRGFLFAGGTRMIFHSNRSGGSGMADLYETTRTRTTLIPVAGAIRGAFGSSYTTGAQISNPTSSTIRGSIVFHPAGAPASPSDPKLQYTLAPFESRLFSDLMSSIGTNGLGSLEIVPVGSAAPSIVVHVGDAAGSEVAIPAIGSDDILATGARAVLNTPGDAMRYRLNIGVRTFSSGVDMTVTLYDATGKPLNTAKRSFEPNSLSQMRASDFAGVATDANQSIVIAIDRGSAVVYGARSSNSSAGSMFQIAPRL
jgi:hypothetical protein